MLKTEIAEIMNQDRAMFEWATKVDKKLNMTAEDNEISGVVDAWAKQIGTKGQDPNGEISEYIVKVIQPEVYDVPDELLSSMFNRGTIGEFDEKQINVDPLNTLVAYDAAKGGNVNKSYIDVKNLKPTWKHKQVETEIKYSDLRRDGFKSVARLTSYIEEALKNKMFFEIFSAIDAAIVGASQTIAAGGTAPSVASMDELALYLLDRGNAPFTVSLSKYAQNIAKMSGYSTFMSDNMKDEYNKYGLTKFYGGISIGSISGAKKTGDNQLLLPDKRIFGIADKIGDLDMRGSLRVYETPDNNREVIGLKVTGFEFGYAITDISKVAKITLT